MVETESMLSVTSIVSTTPALLVVTSRDQVSPAVVTEKVVPLPEMSELGVTFDPLHDE